MHRTAALLLAALVCAVPAGGNVVAELDAATMILTILTHPDDEVFVAPLLASLCQNQVPMKCHLLTMTAGATGRCLLPTCDRQQDLCPVSQSCPCGCWNPASQRWTNLAAVRSQELASAASHLNVHLTPWNYPNDPSDTVQGRIDAWTAYAGDYPTLVANLAGVMTSVGADKLILFDPRHGSTCHVEHRATAKLALAAAETVSALAADDVFLIETLFDPGVHDADCQPTCKKFIWQGFRPAEGGTWVELDVAAGWSSLERVAEIHASQFLPTLLADASPAQRRIWLVRQPNAGLDGESPYVPECSVRKNCLDPCPPS